MTVAQHELRARFAARMSRMYGQEVPAYTTLVEVSEGVNRDHIAQLGAEAERLGSIERVTAERHGAIRVGTPEELGHVARVFAAFGMHPVGFYDLRDSASAVPVVSTAFRPVDRDELARNPFRVFTSMLVTTDPRFFDESLQQELADFLARRRLFDDELLALADRAAAQGGLPEDEADELVERATAVFELSEEPVDEEWYRRLEQISSVAADIGGVPTTHINHLTPRVLDIEALYERMEARGIEMIDQIQGPPSWDGPDVLLRQTSFRALDEERRFLKADGTVGPGTLRVRFGEVEQRGVALTQAGRDLYDRMLAEADELLATEGGERPDVLRRVWATHLPNTEMGLAEAELAFFTYALAEGVAELPQGRRAHELVASGHLVATPVVYEDFLPRSAAGIFQSNLTTAGSKDEAQQGVAFDMARLSQICGVEIRDPYALYAAEQQASLDAVETATGVAVRP
ncbi:VOC family protein [Kytococcus schroeteri]|uniref:2-oxoadipate dioxygenase/decarboxylase n=1 Tax=Kytococcus schroeteri TaxID=138300 RepID=UPI001EDEAA2A|nr:VOC family protein [Kytococcus schroeteri]